MPGKDVLLPIFKSRRFVQVCNHICNHICHHVLLPIFKSRRFVQASPQLTGRTVPRRVLFNFRGNALNQPKAYAPRSDLRDEISELIPPRRA